MPYPAETSTSCDSGRHLLCPWGPGLCACTCHKPMTDAYAQALLLKLAGQRLWPDAPDARQAIADAATLADPFHPELSRALRTLALT